MADERLYPTRPFLAVSAAILRDGFSNVINLLSWSDEEVKTRTVDNMHFSFAGSEWLYEELVKRL